MNIPATLDEIHDELSRSIAHPADTANEIKGKSRGPDAMAQRAVEHVAAGDRKQLARPERDAA